MPDGLSPGPENPGLHSAHQPRPFSWLKSLEWEAAWACNHSYLEGPFEIQLRRLWSLQRGRGGGGSTPLCLGLEALRGSYLGSLQKATEACTMQGGGLSWPLKALILTLWD